MAILVTVVYSPSARMVREWALVLEEGATAAQALQRSGLLDAFPQAADSALLLGVWGRRCGEDHVLRDQDRLEVCRPLKVDPKVARRTRFVQQGARSAGLFACKRPGAKAGY